MDVLERLEMTLSVAMVGVRKPSPEAARAAADFTDAALDTDATIVSGLAYGCDAIAHKRYVDRGGTTIAVMAQGLNKYIHPTTKDWPPIFWTQEQR